MRMITHSQLSQKPMNLFSSRTSGSAEKSNAIKVQIAKELNLDDQATVMVSELACMEEGCPPVETVIAVFRPSMQKIEFRFHHPIVEITAHDICEMCARHITSSSENHHGNCCC